VLFRSNITGLAAQPTVANTGRNRGCLGGSRRQV